MLTEKGLTLALICLTVALSGGGQLLLRAGALRGVERGVGDVWWASVLNAPTLCGLLLWCLSTLVWLLVLRRAPLSYAYCVGSLNYILVPLLSARLFHEPLSPLRFMGMALIFGGVLLTIYANFQAPGQ